MKDGGPTGECILFEIPLKPGGSLALIKTDEDLFIRHGQELVAGCYWRTFELGKAVEEFRELSRRLDPLKLHPIRAPAEADAGEDLPPFAAFA